MAAPFLFWVVQILKGICLSVHGNFVQSGLRDGCGGQIIGGREKSAHEQHHPFLQRQRRIRRVLQLCPLSHCCWWPKWPTSEHYFQAQKFAGTPHVQQVRRASTPMEAASMGRDRKRPLRRDWERAKDNVMRVALYAKFTQHADLRTLLLGTGSAHLVEHTGNDSYWGDGGDGSGRNMLGLLLMELREKLRAEG
jgi:ribA/ribD-fused uncharacterized protein